MAWAHIPGLREEHASSPWPEERLLQAPPGTLSCSSLPFTPFNLSLPHLNPSPLFSSSWPPERDFNQSLLCLVLRLLRQKWCFLFSMVVWPSSRISKKQSSNPGAGKITWCWHTSSTLFCSSRSFSFSSFELFYQKCPSTALPLTSRKQGWVTTELIKGKSVCLRLNKFSNLYHIHLHI